MTTYKNYIALSALTLGTLSACAGKQKHQRTTTTSTSSVKVKSVATSCQAGNAELCHQQGKQFELTGDIDRALTYYTKGCALEYGASCGKAGHIKLTKKRRFKEANVLLNKGCMLNDGFSCYGQAFSVLKGFDGQQDTARGILLFKRSCQSKHRDACQFLGASFLHGRFVTKDIAKAKHYIDYSCTLGDPTACRYLAQNHHQNTPAGLKESHTYMIKACRLKQQRSCIDMHLNQINGRGVEKKVRVGVLGLQHLCVKQSVSRACTEYAHHLMEGVGIEKDTSSAIKLLEKVCKSGEGRACSYLGNYYREGKHTPADLKKAAGYYKEGCALKDPSSCLNLGMAYFQGRGIGQNRSTAHKLFEQTCAQRLDLGCTHAGASYVHGYGIAQDLTKGVKMLTRQCHTNKLWTACYHLAIAHEKLNQPKEARILFERTCANRHPRGCYQLAKQQAKDETSQKKAQTLMKQVCQTQEVADACLHLSNDKTLTNAQRKEYLLNAKTILKKECKQSLRLSCQQLKSLTE